MKYFEELVEIIAACPTNNSRYFEKRIGWTGRSYVVLDSDCKAPIGTASLFSQEDSWTMCGRPFCLQVQLAEPRMDIIASWCRSFKTDGDIHLTKYFQQAPLDIRVRSICASPRYSYTFFHNNYPYTQLRPQFRKELMPLQEWLRGFLDASRASFPKLRFPSLKVSDLKGEYFLFDLYHKTEFDYEPPLSIHYPGKSGRIRVGPESEIFTVDASKVSLSEILTRMDEIAAEYARICRENKIMVFEPRTCIRCDHKENVEYYPWCSKFDETKQTALTAFDEQLNLCCSGECAFSN